MRLPRPVRMLFDPFTNWIDGTFGIRDLTPEQIDSGEQREKSLKLLVFAVNFILALLIGWVANLSNVGLKVRGGTSKKEFQQKARSRAKKQERIEIPITSPTTKRLAPDTSKSPASPKEKKHVMTVTDLDLPIGEEVIRAGRWGATFSDPGEELSPGDKFLVKASFEGEPEELELYLTTTKIPSRNSQYGVPLQFNRTLKVGNGAGTVYVHVRTPSPLEGPKSDLTKRKAVLERTVKLELIKK